MAQSWTAKLTCGQMARANCITEKTLRFYQKKGLLEPAYIDETTGFRHYDILQAAKLDMITQLQAIGFSLDEIKAIDQEKDVASLAARAQSKLEQIHQQQQDLAIAEKLAIDLVADCSAYLQRPVADVPMLEFIPDRHILEFTIDVPPEVLHNQEMSASDLWEWVMRCVKQTIVDHNWPISLYRNVGFLTSVEELSREYSWMNRTFVLVDESFGECFSQAKPLPGGMCVVTYIDEGYNPDGSGRDEERFASMIAYAKVCGFEPKGTAYCEAINRYQRYFNLSLDSYSRYVLPVQKAEE